MMKRRFTQNAVAQIIHSGAPCTISGNAASCALPANTHSDIAIAIAAPSPALDIATPATSPQAPMPSATSRVSRAPAANSGWRHSGVEELIAPLSYGGAPRVARGGEAGGDLLRKARSEARSQCS